MAYQTREKITDTPINNLIISVQIPSTILDAQKQVQAEQLKPPQTDKQKEVFKLLNLLRERITAINSDEPLDEKAQQHLNDYGYVRAHYLFLTTNKKEKRNFSMQSPKMEKDSEEYYNTRFKNEETMADLLSIEAGRKANLNAYKNDEIDEKTFNERDKKLIFAESRNEVETLMKEWGYFELYRQELVKLMRQLELIKEAQSTNRDAFGRTFSEALTSRSGFETGQRKKTGQMAADSTNATAQGQANFVDNYFLVTIDGKAKNKKNPNDENSGDMNTKTS